MCERGGGMGGGGSFVVNAFTNISVWFLLNLFN